MCRTSPLVDSGNANKNVAITRQDYDLLEFHRHAVALMPHPADRFPGIAYAVTASDGCQAQRFCSCQSNRKTTCDHLKKLSRMMHIPAQKQAQFGGTDEFKASCWHDLAIVMTDGCKQALETIHCTVSSAKNDAQRIVVNSKDGAQILVYRSNGADRMRFMQRCTLSHDEGAVPTRGDILFRLSLLTLTKDERFLQERGLKTVRQSFEETFWYRFAYHGFREFGHNGCTFYPVIDESSGDFILQVKDGQEQLICTLPVPRKKVKRILEVLKDVLTNQHGLTVAPLSLDSIFDVRLNEGLDIEIRPMLRLIQKDGEARFFDRADLKRFQYGDLYYIKEMGILVEDQYPAPPPKFKDSVRTVIRKSQVPHFLTEHGSDLEQEQFRMEDKVRNLKIMDSFDWVEITPQAMERDWCWLSISYGDGNQSVSLADIVRARRAKQRFIATDAGWIDCQASAFAVFNDIIGRLASDDQVDNQDNICLSRTDILRLRAACGRHLKIHAENQQADIFKQLLALKPVVPMPAIKGMTSALRAYQQRGVEWLWFLYENNFGGLLCDDMGLGKTHQVMALITGLCEQQLTSTPFLVVSPTTVISHWQQKIASHVPGITAALYYGEQRDLGQVLMGADVILTSYGILLRDAAKLASTPFVMVVFDEIQYIKNAGTKTYAAAQALKADIKVGLTGTPIENSLKELKSLLDLTVPGYLGLDEAFEDRYLVPIEQNANRSRRKELSRLISPFILRRLKKSVLDELPPKIEDTRICRLSEEQVKLYRDVIENRGRELLLSLEQKETLVPYLHIFSVLNMLKQICNHPALIANDTTTYTQYTSGKWDLFTEIMTECLESGQKIVVYSQYLGMIEIINHYLASQKVKCVSLTGASRNRGQIIERFNCDPSCRVFVGSLKAGGMGIDLVAASVVIHYDRWWNAAREDQATDRVHRIGQKRGVQVFKLLTQGTLEEKIATIIAQKRDLMDSIVKEDDPTLVKTFSREELIKMLAMPDDA